MWKKILKWFVIPAGVIVALVAVALFVMHIHYSRVIDKELARIRSEGYPVTREELNAFYPYPKGPNAADVYERAFGLLPKEYPREMPFLGLGELPPKGEPLMPETKMMIGEYLERSAPAIAALCEAAKIEECRYPVDFKLGLKGLRIRHSTALRDSARLLTLAARYDADAGRHAESAENVIAGIAVGKSLDKEPTTISALVGIACNLIAVGGLSCSMSLTQFDETDLQKLAECLQKEPPPENFTRALVAERRLGLEYSVSDMLEAMRVWNKLWNNKDTSLVGARLTVILHGITGMRQRDRIMYLKGMRRLIEISKLPPSEQIKAAMTEMVNVEQKVDTGWPKISGISFKGKSSAYPMSCDSLPGFFRFLLENSKCLAYFRCAQTAVAIERFRLRTGAIPNDLTELVPDYLPAIPIDPFSGKPMQYRRLAKGYVVGTDINDPKQGIFEEAFKVTR